jgi:hypothetical protein
MFLGRQRMPCHCLALFVGPRGDVYLQSLSRNSRGPRRSCASLRILFCTVLWNPDTNLCSIPYLSNRSFSQFRCLCMSRSLVLKYFQASKFKPSHVPRNHTFDLACPYLELHGYYVQISASQGRNDVNLYVVSQQVNSRLRKQTISYACSQRDLAK